MTSATRWAFSMMFPGLWSHEYPWPFTNITIAPQPWRNTSTHSATIAVAFFWWWILQPWSWLPKGKNVIMLGEHHVWSPAQPWICKWVVFGDGIHNQTDLSMEWLVESRINAISSWNVTCRLLLAGVKPDKHGNVQKFQLFSRFQQHM